MPKTIKFVLSTFAYNPNEVTKVGKQIKFVSYFVLDSFRPLQTLK